jgi:predicted regulator of amino acid metabolism with ACT domain
MISELIQKMQELAAADSDYNYQVIKIDASQKNEVDIMATYDCSYDDAKQVEGMLSTNFELDKNQKNVVIAIKRVPK